ncbi:MAG: AAA family ATPase [Gemmatales bacterium]|nr:AAA family ATPase [Gemmatales bacterium]
MIQQNPCFIILATVFRAVRKRWLIALVGACALTVSAIWIVRYLMPPDKFTARALLQFDLAPSGLAESPSQQYYLANLTTLHKTHTALIRSRTVLQSALSRAEVQQLEILKRRWDPVAYIESQLTADFSISPEIMRVTLTGQDADSLQTILRAIVQTYLVEVAHKEHAQVRAELERTRDLIARYEEKIKAKQTRLRELEQAAGSGRIQTLEVFLRGYLEQLDRTRRELALQRHSLRQLQGELDALQPKLSLARMVVNVGDHAAWYLRLAKPKLLDNIVPAAQVDLKLQEEPQYAEKKRTLQRLEAELEAARALLSPQLPEARREALLKTKYDALLEARIQLEELARRLRPSLQLQLVQEFIVSAQQRLNELQDKRVQLIRLENYLQEETENLEKLVATLKRSHLDLQWLKEEIEADQQVSKRLLARKDQLEMLSEAPTRVRLFEDTVVLPAYESKKRWLYMILAISAALGIWLTVLVIWEWRVQPIHGPEELVGRIHAPIITSLPRIQHPLHLTFPIRESGSSQTLDVLRFMESVDALRTLLLYLLQHECSQVIMISSAVQGEGKTSLSCYLAASIARAGRHVLLVDTDLRRPRAHKLLQAVQSPGLSEILQGQGDWRNAVQTDVLPNFDFLPAGGLPQMSIPLLGRDYFHRLLEEWRASYEVILLDSSPVLLVADPLSIVRGTDAVLLSAMYKVSTLPRTQVAYQRLVSIGARILGIVVNGISPRQYDYYYGTYYSYASDHPQLIQSTNSHQPT